MSRADRRLRRALASKALEKPREVHVVCDGVVQLAVTKLLIRTLLRAGRLDPAEGWRARLGTRQERDHLRAQPTSFNPEKQTAMTSADHLTMCFFGGARHPRSIA